MALRALRLSRLGYVSGSGQSRLIRNNSSSASEYKYETLKVQVPSEWVYHVEMNRPDKRNAMNETLWREIGRCFGQLSADANCRAVVLSGAGKTFSAGLDLSDGGLLMKMNSEEDVARRGKIIRDLLRAFQQSFTAIEECPKPVIAAVHSGCIGAGVDLITACDIRYCTKDAWFNIKEADMGLAADVGTLQRLPKVIGNEGLLREWAYTCRDIPSEEAASSGLVSRVFNSKDLLMDSALSLAKVIAAKSPVAIQGTKVNINYARDHTVAESLQFILHWNMLHLQSEDLITAATSAISKSKEPPNFSKL